MDRPRDHGTEQSRSKQKDKDYTASLTPGILKNGANGAGYETEPQRERTEWQLSRRRGWGRDGGGG